MRNLLKIIQQRNGLALRFIVSIFISIAVIFIIIFLYNYQVSKRIVEKNLKSNAENLTKKGVLQIEKILASVQIVPDNYSKIIENSHFQKDELLRILKQEVEINPQIYGAAIAFEPYFFDDHEKYFMAYYYRNRGQYELKYLGDERYDYFTMDWYQIPKELNRPDWSEPYYDEGAGDTIMSTYSVPLYRNMDGKRQFIGILTADVSLDWLQAFVNSINVYQTGYGFVISKNGTIVSHPLKEMIMNESIFSIAEEQKSSQLRQIGLNMISGEESFAEIEYNNVKTGKPSWIAYAPVSLNGWSIGFVFPVDELMNDVYNMSVNVLVLSLAGLLIILIVIILISRSVTSPLRSLSQASKKIAEGNFNVELPDIKTHDEMKELHDSFLYMLKKLAEYVENLEKTTSAREKIESELRIACAIQMAMVPKNDTFFSSHNDFIILGTMNPAKEVGGDLYNFFMRDEEHLVFTIGDVSGKGIAAALFMAMTNTLIKALAMNGLSPADVLCSANKELCRGNEQYMFVTLFMGILNVNTGEVVYANAGHNPAVLIQNEKSAIFMEPYPATILATFEDAEFRNEQFTLNHNDTLFMYTDGVTEAMNTERQLFGEKRFLDLLNKSRELSMPELLDESLKGVAAFANGNEQSDDITLLALRFV